MKQLWSMPIPNSIIIMILIKLYVSKIHLMEF